eukprot:GSMAST32.ASY1.ANO1.1939.1 assembled CDS
MPKLTRINILREIVGTVKVSNQLPSISDGSHDQYIASSETYQQRFQEFSERLRKVINSLLLQASSETLIESDICADDQSEYEPLVSAVDTFLERVDVSLDDIRSGSSNKQSSVRHGELSSSSKPSKYSRGSLEKPQLKFKDPVDNSNTPWRPIITYKDNATTPLRLVRLRSASTDGRALGADIDGAAVKGAGGSYAHPYEAEIKMFDYEDTQLAPKSVQDYEPIVNTKVKWIDTLEGLKDMCATISRLPQVAVDLEHHSHHSFQGITCLMQVSSRKEDWIVDTLCLRSEMHICNSWFSDKSVIKVMHGANKDVEWLQRDFGIYIVNLFDTGQASRILEYPSFSLAYLLKRHCDVIAQKQFQLADWRIRPLTSQMISYAQSDTHYLLYIADVLQNELLDKEKHEKDDKEKDENVSATSYISIVLDRSRNVCFIFFLYEFFF